MKTCLIVSPYFPPSTLAGVHRARHLSKHLPAAGWWPIVVCVDEAYHEQRLDYGLSALVPPSVEIVKTPAIPARLTRPFGLGEIGLRAWQPLRRAVIRLIEARDINAILITGSPFYPMSMAGEIRRRFNVPVVLDFQDPWVSTTGASSSPMSKAGFSHRLARFLEPHSLTGASFVTSVSEIQNAEMAARYNWIDASRMAAIPIGGDADDFARIRESGLETQAGILDANKINLTFAGTFMPRSGGPVRAILAALKTLREGSPAAASRVRLNFIGTSNRTEDSARPAILPIARELGVADAVYEMPLRLPYSAALNALLRSAGLLLIGSDEPHYTASKIYPALMSGRPYLSLFHRESSAHHLLTSAGGGIALSFGNANDLAGLEQPLTAALLKLATEPGSFGRANPSAYAPFEAPAIASRFAEVFEEAAQGTASLVTRSRTPHS